VQLIFAGDGYWNINYDPRAGEQKTGDALTKWFFGWVIPDTIEDVSVKEAAPERQPFGSVTQTREVRSGVFYEVGEHVQIVAGPFRDFSGSILEVSDDGSRVVVEVQVTERLRQQNEFDVAQLGKVSAALNSEDETAKARWDTGPLLSAEQCNGEVVAMQTEFFARAVVGSSAHIRWEDIENYSLSATNHELLLNIGAPWFWFFILDLDDESHRDKWIGIMESKGVPSRE
jgi:hypothetical protein